MCIADRADDKIFEKIKEKYHATVVEYPMVRVANADKTEHSEGRGGSCDTRTTDRNLRVDLL